MPGPPHFSHAALTEALHQSVASELARFGDGFAERVDDARADVRHDGDEQVRQHDPEEERVGGRADRWFVGSGP